VREVDARHDDPGDVALLLVMVDPRERERELVLREGDVREVRVDPGHVLGVDMDVELALLAAVFHRPRILERPRATPASACLPAAPPISSRR
jgi:hypothetical protein